MSHKLSPLSGSKLLGQYFENNRTIGALQQEIVNEHTIARLQDEIDDLRRKLNNNNTDNNNIYGGKKRSNRRKHVKHNKRTRKGSRMHKKRR
jgi:hypothetical protein